MENQGTRSLETFHTIGGINITVKRVMDLVVSALEGGSNYWYSIVGYKDPVDETKVPEGYWHPKERCAWGGGHLKICDKDDFKVYGMGPQLQIWRLDEDAMKRGLELMVTKEYIQHFADFVQEKDDANTADIFLQLSLFGKIIYG